MVHLNYRVCKMTGKVTFETEKTLRSAAPPATVSSKGRGRSVVDLIEHFEKTAPEAIQKKGPSSAALRAGELIRATRKEARLSQAELAQKLSVSQSRISELEAGLGTQGPTWDVMERVAAECGMQLSLSKNETVTQMPECHVIKSNNPAQYTEAVFKTLRTALGAVTEEIVQHVSVNGRTCLAIELPPTRTNDKDDKDDKQGMRVIMELVAVCG
jgi:transcriptional regulator with XRE-family HTH domain